MASTERSDLPAADLLNEQANWLAPMRARLLRRIAIARRRRVLDLGAGYGSVTGELVRRSAGSVAALDRSCAALRDDPKPFSDAMCTCGDATHLPFAAASFDLVFCQCALMWIDLAATIAEVSRVLQAGGVLIALEPDYGGMIEYPPQIATRDLWIAALKRAGADPYIGRKLPSLLAARGFEVRVDLLPELSPPASTRFDLLRGLSLTQDEHAALKEIEEKDATLPRKWMQVVHLPFVLISATKI